MNLYSAFGVQRDERTVSVENASYRLSYMFVCYALLIDTAYRSVVRKEAAWDLMAIIIVSGFVSFAVQKSKCILTRQSIVLLAVCMAAAAAVGAVIALMRR